MVAALPVNMRMNLSVIVPVSAIMRMTVWGRSRYVLVRLVSALVRVADPRRDQCTQQAHDPKPSGDDSLFEPGTHYFKRLEFGDALEFSGHASSICSAKREAVSRVPALNKTPFSLNYVNPHENPLAAT